MSNRVSDTITDETLSRIIQIESGGNPNVKASTSSALGLGQFLNATWLGLVRKYHPEWLASNTQAQVLAMRTDPPKAIEMLAWLCEESAAQLGPGYTEGDLYLSHFLGPHDAHAVLRAPPAAPVANYVSAAAVKANKSILQGKTVAQVRTWASAKMLKAGGHDWVGKYWGEDGTEDIPLDVTPTKADDAAQDAAQDAADALTPSVAHKDTTPHGEVNDQIANVQKSLVAMGYNEVGIINGAWGGGTKAGIAAFLNDRGRDDLPVDMSQSVLDEIAHAQLEAFKRPISEERATIKPKELAKYNPTMLSTLRTKAVAFWGMVTGGVSLAGNALTSYFTTAWQYIQPVRSAIDSVPVFVWIMLAIGLCGFLYWNSQRAEKDTTDAFQNRRLLR